MKHLKMSHFREEDGLPKLLSEAVSDGINEPSFCAVEGG
jgi:hypothetical protein